MKHLCHHISQGVVSKALLMDIIENKAKFAGANIQNPLRLWETLKTLTLTINLTLPFVSSSNYQYSTSLAVYHGISLIISPFKYNYMFHIYTHTIVLTSNPYLFQHCLNPSDLIRFNVKDICLGSSDTFLSLHNSFTGICWWDVVAVSSLEQESMGSGCSHREAWIKGIRPAEAACRKLQDQINESIQRVYCIRYTEHSNTSIQCIRTLDLFQFWSRMFHPDLPGSCWVHPRLLPSYLWHIWYIYTI